MLAVFTGLTGKEFFTGDEEWVFLWDIAFRTFIMFIVIIAGVKILGKRGVKQLSIFELVVIIGLGSAAGDPMLYRETGVISAILVFVVVITLYRMVTYLVERFHFFEKFFEGSPNCLVKEGEFMAHNFRKGTLGTEELFSSLRRKGVSQLGQVELAIEEISGDVSVFFYEDKEVKYGLPILPGSSENKISYIEKEGHYACGFCGHTELKTTGQAGKCGVCGNEGWFIASNKKKVS